MSRRPRRNHSAAFKAKVALEAALARHHHVGVMAAASAADRTYSTHLCNQVNRLCLAKVNLSDNRRYRLRAPVAPIRWLRLSQRAWRRTRFRSPFFQEAC